jgi:hypothetical protein
MAKSFQLLIDNMSPESQTRAEQQAQELLAQLPVEELRQAHQLSHQNLVNLWQIPSTNLAKLEQHIDVYLNSLRSYLVAMGGELEIRANFPQGSVEIDSFANLRKTFEELP